MFSLRLFGGVSLASDTAPLTGAAAQRRRLALLALLGAAPGGRLSRDKIISLLWPESETAKARHLLADSLYELRAALGKDVLSTMGEDVVLDTGRVRVDVAEFVRALSAGDGRAAASLYTGPFLDGFFVADAPEFERWAEERRVQLAHDHSRTLEALAEESEREGDTRAAVAWWKRLAASDPYSSRAAVRLMRAFVASGDPAAAIQHARVHETLLREELGAAPDAEVLALATSLQAPPAPTRDARVRPTSAPVGSAARAENEAAPPAPAEQLTSSAPREPAPQAGRPRLGVAPALVAGLVGLAGVVLAMQWGSDEPEPAIQSLAVLPLRNQSPDPAHAYLAEAITDALRTELAAYGQLTVASRTATRPYADTILDPRTIARELGVDALVEGTVQREHARLRINVSLVSGTSGDIIWSHGYDARIVDLLTLEGEMPREIARKVRVAAAPASHAALTGKRVTTNVIAFDHYYRGRELWRNRTRDGIRQAMHAFRAAIVADPGFALAHAGLADAYRYYGGLNHGPVVPYMDSAWTSVQQALALDNNLSAAHATLGALYTDKARWEDAEREFVRAIDLDERNALAHHWYAMMLATLGRKEGAVREIWRAKELDPHSAPLNGVLSQIETWAGVPKAERRWSLRGVDVDPTFPNARFNAALQKSSRGDCAGAHEEIAVARELAPHAFLVPLSEAGVFFNCGDTATARRMLAELKGRPDARVNGLYLAHGHVVLGERDSAFAWLQREEYWGMSKRFDLATGKALDPLRSDPRYAEVLEKVGLGAIAAHQPPGAAGRR